MKNSIFVSDRSFGFGLLEIVIGTAILVSVLVVSVVVVISLDQKQRDLLWLERAGWLAVEGLEAARYLRDQDWNNLAGLEREQEYGLSLENEEWVLVEDPDLITENDLSRVLSVEEVRRASDGQVDPTGEVVPGSLLVTVRVFGDMPSGREGERSIATYLNDLFHDE